MSEGAARKFRSLEILRAEDVPFLESLPEIETTGESLRRSEREVVRRAIALTIAAVKGETGDNELTEKVIDQFSAHTFFTPKEKQFIADANPTDHQRIQFSWRYECVFVLLWALGFVERLSRPQAICDVPWIADLLRTEGADGLQAKAMLRPQRDILDAADLIYRYHWAVRDAQINQKPIPGGLEPGVVMERHHALNWLIGYDEADWDDVPTDT